MIVAEFVALTRLMRAMLGVSIARAARVIAVLFVAGDAISLIAPERFYSYALTPSLVALYVSQAIVFLVYPRFRGRPDAARVARGRGRHRPGSIRPRGRDLPAAVLVAAASRGREPR